MHIEKRISTVDCHTAGEPTRIVTGGIPHVPGKTMMDKKIWLQDHLDSVRKMLMWEPRGHKDMFGALITSPCDENAHAGVIFMDSKGYLNMCGHGTIAVVTVLLNTGMIPMVDEVILDTPAGRVTARADIEAGNAVRVRVRNVPAFFCKRVTLSLPYRDINALPVDIAYGGNFFALVDVAALGIPMALESIESLKQAALEIREEIGEKEGDRIVHPESGVKMGVPLIELYQKGTATGPTVNMVVFGNGQIDRSPCGTGTCAKMALLHAEGKLAAGETFPHQSILGTRFEGKILQETTMGETDAVLPEICGDAYITGFHDFVMEKNDPFNEGFEL